MQIANRRKSAQPLTVLSDISPRKDGEENRLPLGFR
jgi:hypothetical protein